MGALMDPNASKLSVETIGRAVDALLKFNKSKSKSQKPQLFDQDDYFLLNLTLKKIPQKGRVNPFKIPLPNPFHPFDSSEEYCLIIDDRSKSSLTSAAAKKKIQSENIPISKVLKLSKLKSDYRPFEAKRKLMNSYDMFFADKRIIPLLPRLLGKEFFKKKKIPIPVDLTHKGWKEQFQIGCESSLMYLRSGTCTVVKVGRVSQGRDAIVENVVAAVNGMVEIIPKKWGNVRAFHLKLTESLALPVYQCVPEVGLKIEGVKKKEMVVEERKAESGDEEVDEKEKKQGKKKTKKGRIQEVRYMDELLGGDMSSDDEDGYIGTLNGAFGSGELIGTKRKKADKKEKKIAEEVSGEKELKRSVKAKKGDITKRESIEKEVDEEKESKKMVKAKKGDGGKKKDDLFSESEGGDEEIDGDGLLNTSSEAKKKKSKTGKVGSVETKMKKKSKRLD